MEQKEKDVKLITSENYTNKILRHAVELWGNTSPYYKKYLESYRPLLAVIDSLSFVIPDKEMITKFVFGLVTRDLSIRAKDETNRQRYKAQTNRLTKPIFDILINQLKTEGYRDEIIKKGVIGEDKITTDFGYATVTKKVIEEYIIRTEALPITIEDIEKIILEYAEYIQKLYAKKNSYKGSSRNMKLI